YEKVENWVKEFSLDIVGYAFEIAVSKETKTFAFVRGILNNWKSAGYKTCEQIKEAEKKQTNIKFTKDGYEIGKVYEVDGIKFKFDAKGEKHIL
ncbi:MAG: DnaD domain protein, partial [Bacilli bacterium]|nr:DnaD domain protein [Bacilli bacterium]